MRAVAAWKTDVVCALVTKYERRHYSVSEKAGVPTHRGKGAHQEVTIAKTGVFYILKTMRVGGGAP